MKTYVISDNHFSHFNIIGYTNRPFDTVGQMNDHMIKVWNETVKPEDVVYHLGDIALCTLSQLYELMAQLNGTIHLIKGNHDRHNDKHYLAAGIASTQKHLVMDDVLLSHYPGYVNEESPFFNKEKSKRLYIKNLAEQNNCKYIIHGHVHNLANDYPNHFNASVERLNYIPIELDQVIAGLRK